MKFNVLTLFPELFEQYLSQTILKRAAERDIIDFNIVNIRDYARNKHSQMDDIPFGGGAGMVLKPEAYWNFFYENYEFYNNENNENSKKPYVIFLSPQGKQLTHKKVIDKFVDEEISIGDYVLSSGDLPSLVIMDSVIRIKEGIIKKESFETDSFYNGLLGFPQYTRPVEIDGYTVPEVLRSGNHAKIDEYRQFHSIEKTMKNRIDLFEKKLESIDEDLEFKKVYEKYLKNKNM